MLCEYTVCFFLIPQYLTYKISFEHTITIYYLISIKYQMLPFSIQGNLIYYNSLNTTFTILITVNTILDRGNIDITISRGRTPDNSRTQNTHPLSRI